METSRCILRNKADQTMEGWHGWKPNDRQVHNELEMPLKLA